MPPGGLSRLSRLSRIFFRKRSRRVALDKEKGFVKGKDILSGAEHRLLGRPERLGTESSGDITA
jgi:hypothetical protein